MFKSFKSLKTVRTLFDQAGNLYRVAKRVLEKVGSRFRGGYKRFAKNSLFYTEALPTVTSITASYTKGAGFESINQSQVSGLRSFSAYDIIGASSIDDQYLTFKPNVSSSDYPKPTFDPDDSVGAGIFTKSLWNHNQLAYSEDYFTGTTTGYFSNFQSADWTDTGETLMDGMKIFKYLAPIATDHYLTTKPHERYITYDDSKLSFFSFYMKADDNPSLRLNDLRIYFNDLTPETNTRVDVFGWGPTRLIPDQPFYADRFTIEDVGNGWVRFTMLPEYFKFMRDTYGNLKSGDDLRFTILFNDVPAGGSVYLAGLQYEQHPLNKPSWSHNQFSGYDEWVEGSGPQLPDWNQIGTNDDNKREYRTDPFGKQSVIWVSDDDPASDQDFHDGGIRTAKFSVDTSKEYRASLFMKVNAPDLGAGASIQLGYGNGSDPDTALIRLSDPPSAPTTGNQYAMSFNGANFDGNPYNPNEWYLAVYYLKPEGTATPSITSNTGLYDLEGNFLGLPYTNIHWGMTSATLTTGIEVRVYNNPNNTGQEIEYWGLRMDAVDGNEPSISDLLNPIDNPNYPPVTKATPYVGNDAVPANVHRHNWLTNTNDLATSSNWHFNRVDLQPSTIGTSVYSGETAYEVVPDDPIGNWPIIYTSGDGISFNADETKVASVYIKSHDKNPTFMPPMNSNLSGLDKWSVGTGDDPSTDWEYNQDLSENERLYLDTPFGGLDVVWRATNLDTDNDGEGGYRSTHFNIDRTKKYRFSQFVRTSTHNDTIVYLGQTESQSADPTNRQIIKGDDGLPAENYHYFATSYRLPSSDEWYLMVGHIHPEGTSTPVKDAETGLYDMSGNLVDNGALFRDFVFSSTTTETMIRGLSYYNPSTNPDTVDFWHPRVEICDGNEPSIERLLDSVKAKQPAVNFPAFAEIPWLDEGLTNFNVVSGWVGVDQSNATTTTSSLKTPFNTEEVVVVANNEPSPDGPYEGGIQLQQQTVPIDNTKKYRYSIFAKKATNEGGMYLGPYHYGQANAEVLRLNNGALDTNPYFHQNKDFGTSEWVLMVGHIWPYTTASGTANDPDSGVWTMDGNKIAAYSNDFDFMTRSTTTEQGFRAFFWGDVTDDLNKAYFWQPRIDIVDGTEPSIEELLRLQPGLTINLLDFSAPTKIHRAAFGVDASGAVYPKYIVGGELDGFGVEEVGDGWYRAWAYKEGLDSVSNTVEGDNLYYYLYFADAAQPFADVSATITNDFRSTLIMKPMVERLGIDQVVSDPPTAYQEVSDNTWPSVSAIPYHQVAKEVELSIKDDTTGSSYTAKAYWDGGKLYNYGPRITNQDVEITQLQDGWHKFGTGIRGLGDGTINTGDTASMTFSYAASSNPRSKTLISGPILANTGSEKSSKVNYSVGTTTPGLQYLVSSIPYGISIGGISQGPAMSSISYVDHTGPSQTSAYIAETDEGISGGANRDFFNVYTEPVGGLRLSEHDSIVGQLPAKSLWNYNQLPYTRNMLDDPGFNYEGDTNGTFYSLGELQYPIDATDKGPDGVSQALTFYNDHPSLGTRQFIDVGALSYIPSSTLHAWDENLVVNFSIHLKRPDNVEDTVPRFLLYLSDNTDPQNTQAIYFDWGPSSTHPFHYPNNSQYKQVTFTDAGDGWYRVCWSVSGFGYDPNQNVHNGDKVSFRVLALDSVGKSIKYAQPQIEFHTINDTNLLKPSWDWYEVDGAQGTYVNGWSLYGGNNKISLREDPFGLSSLCVAGFDNNTNDGGIVDYPLVPIDSNSTYRYSFFMRFVDTSADTRVLFGPNSPQAQPEQTVIKFNGVIDNNPYFSTSFRYSNIGDDWVLIVAHLHDSSESFPITNHPDTGVYRMDGTEIPFAMYDYASSSVTTTQGGRIFALGSTDDNGREIYQIWSPRVEKVDGTEPSITELLASGNLWTNPNYQQTLPSPYVENVGIHPNPHRHNWLVATNDLDNASYWNFGNHLTMEASTVQTTYANGETCFIMRNGSEADQYGYFNQNQANNGLYFDEDNEYIASIYVKRDEPYTGSLEKVVLTFRDNTNPQQAYGIQYNFSGSVIDNAFIGSNLLSAGVNGGYEELPEGWYRLWVHVPNVLSSTVDNDNLAFILYNGDFGTSYASKELIVMRPMLEIVPSGTVVNNVPRAYQEVDGVWDLGVTSIPEHQCSKSVKLIIGDYTSPTSNLTQASFDFEGGVVKLGSAPTNNGNYSISHMGDGWYNAVISASGFPTAGSREGDLLRLGVYPTEESPQATTTEFSMFDMPFMTNTGSLTTSSVDYNP